MKKYILAASAMLLALSAMFTACSSQADEVVTELEQETVPMRKVYLNATLPNEDGSRAFIRDFDDETNTFDVAGFVFGDTIKAWYYDFDAEGLSAIDFVLGLGGFVAEVPEDFSLQDQIMSMTYGSGEYVKDGVASRLRLPQAYYLNDRKDQMDVLLAASAMNGDLTIIGDTLSAKFRMPYALVCFDNQSSQDQNIIWVTNNSDRTYYYDETICLMAIGMFSSGGDETPAYCLTAPAGKKAFMPIHIIDTEEAGDPSYFELHSIFYGTFESCTPLYLFQKLENGYVYTVELPAN
ncbi:MAG: hypothetical protein Q4B58_08095 [Bacteroidales bacterium]|nr:hypothetical protein [Bacteroidales bacterium]